MIKWNEVTWYSRWGAIVLFLVVVPTLSFYIGTEYEALLFETENLSISTSTSDGKLVPSVSIQERSSIESYTPLSIDLRPTSAGTFKEYLSPNGEYIAHSYTDEGGGSGIYISNSKTGAITKTYCGNFTNWSDDSKKVKVFVPSQCLGTSKDYKYFYFYLDVTGITEKPFIDNPFVDWKSYTDATWGMNMQLPASAIVKEIDCNGVLCQINISGDDYRVILRKIDDIDDEFVTSSTICGKSTLYFNFDKYKPLSGQIGKQILSTLRCN